MRRRHPAHNGGWPASGAASPLQGGASWDQGSGFPPSTPHPPADSNVLKYMGCGGGGAICISADEVGLEAAVGCRGCCWGGGGGWYWFIVGKSNSFCKEINTLLRFLKFGCETSEVSNIYLDTAIQYQSRENAAIPHLLEIGACNFWSWLHRRGSKDVIFCKSYLVAWAFIFIQNYL